MRTLLITAIGLIVATAVTLPAPVLAQRRDMTPFKSSVYDVEFNYPRRDWTAVPAAGGNIALVMHRRGEASLALDYTVLRVALAPDEIDDTFMSIEAEALTQRAPHARIVSAQLTQINERAVIVIKYGAAGLTGDLDVTQYSFVAGAGLYRLTCAVARNRVNQHGAVCDDAAQSLVIGG